MKRLWNIILPVLLLGASASLIACSEKNEAELVRGKDRSGYFSFLDTEPVMVDPQRTTTNYTVPLNIFDRLVEMDEVEGSYELIPSLAEAWEISDDGLEYTFHLRKGVEFSNGEQLTADDVRYTFMRLLTFPDSKNRDLVLPIQGAAMLRDGFAADLAGFNIIDDYTFTIKLEYPYPAFLEGLSAPGASILDEKTTEEAGDSFGNTAALSVGTGPFILEEWIAGREILLKANEKCWSGAPKCDGLKMMFYTETDPLQNLFLNGEVDILDLDMLGMDAEFFLHGDTYRSTLIRGQRVGIAYIALNESVKPLDDVRVRRALQLALDRDMLMKVSIGGRGFLENGIFPRGLKGHNPDLPAVEQDVEEARRLLEESGHSDGFDLEISYSDTLAQSSKDMLRLAASMWEKIGVRPVLTEMENARFLEMRNDGKVACYTATWSADYNDPDNFIYTFFGNVENTTARSLCYADHETMKLVHNARSIVDEKQRLKEYQDLEKKIILEDVAWIPLYSRLHFFVINDRVGGFELSWTGWSSTRYDNLVVLTTEE